MTLVFVQAVRRAQWDQICFEVQAFLDFCSFNFHDFRFTGVYNAIIFSFPLVLLSKLDLRGFLFRVFFLCLHINSINRGMPVSFSDSEFTLYLKIMVYARIAKQPY
jgi:hypothetical protein